MSGFRYDNNDYYYHKNIFGDVLGIYDANGNAVAKYTYSAFGIATVSNLTEDNLGSLNPFRYRSYYWDNEFSLYYLQSRYYDPTIGRFISPDSPEYLDPYNVNGLNLYTYCANNPIMYSDPSGHFLEALAYAFKNWGKNIINVFAEISETIVKEVQDNLFIGAEYGIKGRKVIGDETKPISFFMQNTSDWWKFWEFKYGVKVKIGNSFDKS